jgi:hypothetical protein
LAYGDRRITDLQYRISLRLRYKLVGAVKWRDNIFLADHIASPFCDRRDPSENLFALHSFAREQEYIILHEQTHIRRFDHVIKIIAFMVLILHCSIACLACVFFYVVKTWKCLVMKAF